MEEGPQWLVTALSVCWGGVGGHEECILGLMESFSFPLTGSVDSEVYFLEVYSEVYFLSTLCFFSLERRAADSPGPRILTSLCAGPKISSTRGAPTAL